MGYIRKVIPIIKCFQIFYATHPPTPSPAPQPAPQPAPPTNPPKFKKAIGF